MIGKCFTTSWSNKKKILKMQYIKSTYWRQYHFSVIYRSQSFLIAVLFYQYQHYTKYIWLVCLPIVIPVYYWGFVGTCGSKCAHILKKSDSICRKECMHCLCTKHSTWTGLIWPNSSSWLCGTFNVWRQPQFLTLRLQLKIYPLYEKYILCFRKQKITKQ